MTLNQEQIEAIRRLVDAAQDLEVTTDTVTCEEEHGEGADVKECGAVWEVEYVVQNPDALEQLQTAARECEFFLEKAPTLPSEIESARVVAELERELLSL